MKNLLTTIFALLTCWSLTAQPGFAPLGAKWTYKSSGGFMTSGRERISTFTCIAADSVAGKLIKTISHDIIQQELYNGRKRLEYRNRESFHVSIDSVYEENDTLFIYNPLFQKYTPLYVFNVQEGDTLKLPALELVSNNIASAFDSTMTIVIDSIRMVDYGGITSETFYTSSYDGGIDYSVSNENNIVAYLPRFNWTYKYYSTQIADSNGNPMNYWMLQPIGAYTRLFGGVGIGLKPVLGPNFNNATFDGYLLTDTITCYEDEEISFNLSVLECDSFKVNIPFTSINESHPPVKVSIFPNPCIGDIVHIDSERPFAKGTRITISDISGKTILMDEDMDYSFAHQLNIKQLLPGLYFINIETGGKRFYYKFTRQ